MNAVLSEQGTATHHGPLQARCARIDLLVLDVDGVLTDGRVIYGDNGVELKAFHIRDGFGVKAWLSAGKHVAIITGRSSRVVETRAAELGIRHVYQGVADKGTTYRLFLANGGWKPEQVCGMGDDLPDLPVLSDCGLAVAVADACAEIRSAAHYITQSAGGCGAVRETIELILRCQGRWPLVVERFHRPDPQPPAKD